MSTATWCVNDYQSCRCNPRGQVCFGLRALLSFTGNQLTPDLQTSFPHVLRCSKPLRKMMALEQSPPTMFYLLHGSSRPEAREGDAPGPPCPGSACLGATFSIEAVKKQIQSRRGKIPFVAKILHLAIPENPRSCQPAPDITWHLESLGHHGRELPWGTSQKPAGKSCR